MATSQVADVGSLKASITAMEAAGKFEGHSVTKENYVKEFFSRLRDVSQKIETVAKQENMTAIAKAGEAVGAAITKFETIRKEQKIEIVSGKQGSWQKFCQLLGRVFLGKTYVAENPVTSIKEIVDAKIAKAFLECAPADLPVSTKQEGGARVFRPTASGLIFGDLKNLSYETARKLHEGITNLDKCVWSPRGPIQSGQWYAVKTGDRQYNLVKGCETATVSVLEDGQFSINGEKRATLAEAGFSPEFAIASQSKGVMDDTRAKLMAKAGVVCRREDLWALSGKSEMVFVFTRDFGGECIQFDAKGKRTDSAFEILESGKISMANKQNSFDELFPQQGGFKGVVSGLVGVLFSFEGCVQKARQTAENLAKAELKKEALREGIFSSDEKTRVESLLSPKERAGTFWVEMKGDAYQLKYYNTKGELAGDSISFILPTITTTINGKKQSANSLQELKGKIREALITPKSFETMMARAKEKEDKARPAVNALREWMGEVEERVFTSDEVDRRFREASSIVEKYKSDMLSMVWRDKDLLYHVSVKHSDGEIDCYDLDIASKPGSIILQGGRILREFDPKKTSLSEALLMATNVAKGTKIVSAKEWDSRLAGAKTQLDALRKFCYEKPGNAMTEKEFEQLRKDLGAFSTGGFLPLLQQDGSVKIKYISGDDVKEFMVTLPKDSKGKLKVGDTEVAGWKEALVAGMGDNYVMPDELRSRAVSRREFIGKIQKSRAFRSYNCADKVREEMNADMNAPQEVWFMYDKGQEGRSTIDWIKTSVGLSEAAKEQFVVQTASQNTAEDKEFSVIFEQGKWKILLGTEKFDSVEAMCKSLGKQEEADIATVEKRLATYKKFVSQIEGTGWLDGHDVFIGEQAESDKPLCVYKTSAGKYVIKNGKEEHQLQINSSKDVICCEGKEYKSFALLRANFGVAAKTQEQPTALGVEDRLQGLVSGFETYNLGNTSAITVESDLQACLEARRDVFKKLKMKSVVGVFCENGAITLSRATLSGKSTKVESFKVMVKDGKIVLTDSDGKPKSYGSFQEIIKGAISMEALYKYD